MRRLVILACALGSAVAAPTSAQVHRLQVRQVDNGGMGDLAGTVTNDLSIDFTGELRGQQLRLELTQGTIYQHPEGTNLPPDADRIPLVANLAYDTFLAMGGTDSALSYRVLNFRLRLDDPPPFGPNYIFAAWAPATGVVILDQSDFLTARVTLSGDAQGTWSYFGSVADSWRTFGAGTVSGGVMIVAEPATLLLACATLGLLCLVPGRVSASRKRVHP